MQDKEFKVIPWDELKVGDIFEDGSVVEEIEPWDYQKCYEIHVGECGIDTNGKAKVLRTDSIVVSENHLLMCDAYIYDRNLNNLRLINEMLVNSKNEREVVGEKSIHWLTAGDIYNLFMGIGTPNDINIILQFYSFDSDTTITVGSVKPYKNGKPQKVRCIRTSTGHYQTGLFLNHNTGTKDVSKQQDTASTIIRVFDGWPCDIIDRAKKAETTLEAREIIYNGLKEQYANAKIAMDEINLQLAAKKMTSYCRDEETGALRQIRSANERCTIVGAVAIGSANNIFKAGQLATSYKKITTPLKQEIKPDAANRQVL